MLGKKLLTGFGGLSISLGAVLATATGAVAQGAKEYVLHNFNLRNDGVLPSGGLIFDAAGNLYGVSDEGGNVGYEGCKRLGYYRCGTVFELSPTLGGGWAETILYSFDYTDGASPNGTLVLDALGNLYGTASNGGSAGIGTTCPPPADGCGVVFELSPVAGGGWAETVVHTFDYTDGALPNGGLVSDAGGNLYGTTVGGGGTRSSDLGTVFELSATVGGAWSYSVLHVFEGTGNGTAGKGAGPRGNLIVDGSGNLYGTTSAGGRNGSGTAFELSPQVDGTWTQTVLYSFGDGESDGVSPTCGLIFDATGSLYGTTDIGGTDGGGTVFELSPASGGGWTETVLYDFPNKRSQESVSSGSLVFDAAGNLYGATLGDSDRCNGGCGTIFKLSNSNGVWTESTILNFDGSNGETPNASLIFDGEGNLYGTTRGGGNKGVGVVFELVP